MNEELTIVSSDGYISTPEWVTYCEKSALPFVRCDASDGHAHVAMVAGRDELIAEIVRLREWLEGIADTCRRAKMNAIHVAPPAVFNIAAAAEKALAGGAEDYQYRDRPHVTETIADDDASDFGAEYEDLKL